MITWTVLQFALVAYFSGVLWLRRQGWQLSHYIWGAFGLAFVSINLALLQGWDTVLAGMEAHHLRTVLGLFGVELELIGNATVMVPDPTGWSGLSIGVESSTLIELSVFAGLLLYYPKLSLQRRGVYLGVGIIGTYVLNLFRLVVIVLMILMWGKPAVPLAHAVVGRLVYFVGVVALYWYLLTKPTLHLVNRAIESSGRAVY